MKVKTLKISEAIHKELKIFIAQNSGENMAEFAGTSIVKELKERGHKFIKNNGKNG